MSESIDPGTNPFGRLHRLDPSVRKVWTLKLVLFGALLFVGAVVYDITNLFDEQRWLPIGVASGTVILLATVLAIVLPGLRYRFWWFALTDRELVLERGILNRVRTVVPLRRVQHLDVSQDILEREFGLGKLIVHTAGTRSSEVILPGLQHARAEELRDRIKSYIVDDAL